MFVKNQLLALIAAAIGLALGVLVSWLLSRGRITAASKQARAAIAAQLATTLGRARYLKHFAS